MRPRSTAAGPAASRRKPTFEAGVAAPAQSGERIRAAAAYLNVQQLIPEDRVAQTMNDLFGAPLLRPASLTGLW